MADPGPAARHQLELLAAAYPAWRMSQDGEQAFTATSMDDRMCMTGRSPAELECLLDNEAWKPLSAGYGFRGQR